MIPSASAKNGRKKRYTFRDYLNRRALTMLALGFSSGLPFLLVGNTFGFWLRDEGTSLKAIGFLSWVGLAYSLQFVWAPLVDRIPVLKKLGQRRGWMLLSQCAVALGMFAMAFAGVRFGVLVLGGCALVVGLSAATQDIAINAWRIEVAQSEDEQGLLISAYTLSYRIAVMCTDSLMLIGAQHFG
jgi:PAT family beta-lactamase induction signal transducer AmpG